MEGASRSAALLMLLFLLFTSDLHQRLLCYVAILACQPAAAFLWCSRRHALFLKDCSSLVLSKGFGSRARRHLCPPCRDADRRFFWSESPLVLRGRAV